MKNVLKRTLIIVAIIVILAILSIVIITLKTPTYRAVIVKVNDKSMIVEGINNELISVGFKENIGFKPNQEVLIYFGGTILESYPGQLSNVKKIKIVKEKSNIQVSKNALWYCYNSKNNVNITITELTKKGIILNIIDKNDIPYEYSHRYKITKKIKNPNYTGIGYKIGKDTSNSTAGYTRNWGRIYMGRS